MMERSLNEIGGGRVGSAARWTWSELALPASRKMPTPRSLLRALRRELSRHTGPRLGAALRSDARRLARALDRSGAVEAPAELGELAPLAHNLRRARAELAERLRTVTATAELRNLIRAAGASLDAELELLQEAWTVDLGGSG